MCDKIICHLFGIKFPGFNEYGFHDAFQRCKVLIFIFKCGYIYQAFIQCYLLWLMDTLLGTKGVTVVDVAFILFVLALCRESCSLKNVYATGGAGGNVVIICLAL